MQTNQQHTCIAKQHTHTHMYTHTLKRHMSVITTDNGNIIQKPDSNEMVDCLPLHVTHRVVNGEKKQ